MNHPLLNLKDSTAIFHFHFLKSAPGMLLIELDKQSHAWEFAWVDDDFE